MLDAGMQFTGTSQEQAERLVKEFVKAGQARRKDTEDLVRQVVERGRTATEHVVAAVHAEVNKQMAKFAGRIDELEARVEEIAKRLGLPSSAVKPSKKAPAKKAPAKKAAAKKTPAKKTPAKKATAAR
jgi:polyhydroxyalkanoate synthesis regulator phasin